MALILARVIGNGTEDNTFRVAFPSYRTVEIDYARLMAVIEVRDVDMPDVARNDVETPFLINGKNLAVKRFLPGRGNAWNQHVRERYQEGHSAWDSNTVLLDH